MVYIAFKRIYEYLMDGVFFYSRHQEAFEGKLVVNYMQILHSVWISLKIKFQNETFFSVFHHSAILVFSIK